MTIAKLRAGDRLKIVGFKRKNSACRKKLLMMGLVPGTEVTLVRVAPLGDPVEILVRGSSLVLRKSEMAILIFEQAA